MGLEAAAILVGLTVCRWVVKTTRKNEFDNTQGVNEICKFCQIIENNNEENRCYEDELVFAFEDISKTAKKHYLVCSKQHIKDVYSLTQKDLLLLEHMNKIADKLLKQNSRVVVVDPDN